MSTATDRRLTKNEKRRLKKKSQSLNENGKENHQNNNKASSDENHSFTGVEIEYVAPDYINDLGLDPDLFETFHSVFSKFTKPEDLLSDQPRFTISEKDIVPAEESTLHDHSSNPENSESIEVVKKLSKKKKKLLSRLSVSELKQLVSRPDVVEAHDITSSDPRLLILLKAYRNSVPVPRHWCHVRKYLQGKRGIEKIPYQLPEFIAETGIAKIRETVLEQESLKKGKQKARERVRPKMGKIDIDYQVLHDAFFKYQTKPRLSNHGDLYYEGKEFEVQAKEKKPGVLSSELITALGMNEGSPPPWLINMQRYGPPQSYPNLRIPGLNAPLPPGAAYGYQPGGWGKPPVDEYGRPLYGDVFGVAATTEIETTVQSQVDKDFRWGNFEIEDEEEIYEEEEDNEAEGEEEEMEPYGAGKRANIEISGLETPSTLDGTASLIAGMETPLTIDLRKRAGIETPDVSVSGSGPELYQVIKEKKAAVAGQLFGSDKKYVLSGKGDGNISEEVDQFSKGKESVREGLESQISQDSMFRHMNNYSTSVTEGTETEEDRLRGSKKRKAEQTIISKKVKEFKF